MAAVFPVNMYPILRTSSVDRGLGVVRDVMQDGSPRVRTVDITGYATITIEFAPLLEFNAPDPDASSLASVIRLLSSQEVEMAVGNDLYYGFFWSDISRSVLGPMHFLSVDFYGRW